MYVQCPLYDGPDQDIAIGCPSGCRLSVPYNCHVDRHDKMAILNRLLGSNQMWSCVDSHLQVGTCLGSEMLTL